LKAKERLLDTLNKRPTDRPPFICPGGMMNMAVAEVMQETGCSWPEAHTDAEKMAALSLGASLLSGIENLGVPFCMTIEAEAMGATVDLGSAETEPKVVDYALSRLEDYPKLSPLDMRAGRPKVCLDAIQILKRKMPEIPVIANLTGPVSLATSLVDPLLYYRAVRKDKETAHKVTGIATENLTRFGNAMLEAGADVLCISDPSATGEILGRQTFEEFALPYINDLVEHFRSRFGVPTIVHICGNVKCLGDILARIAAEAVSVDSVVSMKTLKSLAAEKVTMGNVSTYLLERGDTEAVYKMASLCLSHGADILAPACGVSPKTPIDNLKSMARAATGMQHPSEHGEKH
jgi:MtaA/CmuA family methyltransferase